MAKKNIFWDNYCVLFIPIYFLAFFLIAWARPILFWVGLVIMWSLPLVPIIYFYFKSYLERKRWEQLHLESD